MSPNKRHLDEARPHGLPGDDFARLCKHDRLNKHFEHRGNRDAEFPEPARSAYRDVGISQSERSRISEVRAATRAVLGGSFDFTDEFYERSRRPHEEHQRIRGWINDEPHDDPIPQKYRDEFNKLWHEDDMANDSSRYQDDCTRSEEARWREHVMLDLNDSTICPESSRWSDTSSVHSRVDSVMDSDGYRRPGSLLKRDLRVLVSKFSSGSLGESIEQTPHLRRKYLGRFSPR